MVEVNVGFHHSMRTAHVWRANLCCALRRAISHRATRHLGVSGIEKVVNEGGAGRPWCTEHGAGCSVEWYSERVQECAVR